MDCFKARYTPRKYGPFTYPERLDYYILAKDQKIADMVLQKFFYAHDDVNGRSLSEGFGRTSWVDVIEQTDAWLGSCAIEWMVLRGKRTADFELGESVEAVISVIEGSKKRIVNIPLGPLRIFYSEDYPLSLDGEEVAIPGPALAKAILLRFQ